MHRRSVRIRRRSIGEERADFTPFTTNADEREGRMLALVAEARSLSIADDDTTLRRMFDMILIEMGERIARRQPVLASVRAESQG